MRGHIWCGLYKGWSVALLNGGCLSGAEYACLHVSQCLIYQKIKLSNGQNTANLHYQRLMLISFLNILVN